MEKGRWCALPWMGGEWSDESCPFAGWKWMPWNLPGWPGMFWWPGMMWGPGEERMQKHMCQSGGLQSGAVQQLLLGLDMKINNLTLIKTNMLSMAQRTATEYSTWELQSLDSLISGFDAQRKLLETNPESFCANTGTWTTLNENMRKVMMEGVSGQVSKFREKGKWGRGMMWWLK